MNFNRHLNFEGLHAFMSASKYHWVNYSDEKLLTVWKNAQAAERGTRIHALAKEHIELGIKMPRTKKTLDAFVNDAIGFRMTPEVVLVYSENCFGTADAIGYREDDNFLRIHDLKTGDTAASMMQLRVYMALFCLEYRKEPEKIEAELRIYQNDDVAYENPNPEDIRKIMDTIIRFDNLIKLNSKKG